MSLVLGIDVGTTNIKAGLIDTGGKVIASTSLGQVAVSKHGEHDPRQVVDRVFECGRKVIGNKAEQVVSVSLSAYQYGLVVLDRRNEPLTNITTLNDARAGGESFEKFLAGFDVADLYATTGCPPFPQAILPRLFHFSRAGEQAYREGACFASAKAWLLYKLTGDLITEPTTESASQLLDIHRRDWDGGILDQIGLSVDQMPAIVSDLSEPRELVGEARAALGVGLDCRVVPGIYDGGALALGMNCVKAGSRGVSNMGTTGMLRLVGEEPLFDHEGMGCQPFCFADGQYLNGGAINNAGSAFAWMDAQLGFTEDPDWETAAARVPAGCDGLVFLPYLTPERDHRLQGIGGSLIGLRSEIHSKAHIARAVIEGIAYNLRRVRECIPDPIEIDGLHVGGGVYQSELTSEIIANVLGLPLYRSGLDEPALVGNAVLGFLGAGEFASLVEAGQALTDLDSLPAVEPNPDASERYDAEYQSAGPGVT